jgi:ABC-type iron transport system FetAB permease component
MTPILLTPFDVAVAASLILLDAVLSILLKLRLHWQITIAAARMVLQLVAIGYVLRFIFASRWEVRAIAAGINIPARNLRRRRDRPMS